MTGNTGYFLLLSNYRTRQMLDEFETKCAHNKWNDHDQTILGDILMSKHMSGLAKLQPSDATHTAKEDHETKVLRYCNLDPLSHATGYATNNFGAYKKNMDRLGLEAVVLHANWCVGHDQKVANLKGANAWLGDCELLKELHPTLVKSN